LTKWLRFGRLIKMTKIRSIRNDERFFYFQSGDWESFISADSRESALDELIKILKIKPNTEIGKVLICMDVSKATADLTLEDSLFFIPVEDIMGRFEL